MTTSLQSLQAPPHPEDKRWRLVSAAMRRHGYEGDALIEVLHTAQSAFGFLDEEAMHYVAANLKVPLSRVYGVATFYNHFTLKPQGEHTCLVCMGTACYIKGSPAILSEIQDYAHINAGETTPDKKVSLMIARCLGTCGLAPAAVFDGEVMGKVEPSAALARVEEWMES